MNLSEEPWRSYPQETDDLLLGVLDDSSYRASLEEDSRRLFASEDVDIDFFHRGQPEGSVCNTACDAGMCLLPLEKTNG